MIVDGTSVTSLTYPKLVFFKMQKPAYIFFISISCEVSNLSILLSSFSILLIFKGLGLSISFAISYFESVNI